jgi:hypothetical protein
MENNTTENNKSGICKKLACCKHHRIIAPIVLITLFIIVFGAGLAIGHGRGRDRNYGEGGRWKQGGCLMGGSNYQCDKFGRKGCSMHNQANFQENRLNGFFLEKNLMGQPMISGKIGAKDSTSTSQVLESVPSVKK